MANLQPDVFVFRAGVSGSVFADGNRDGVRQPMEPGVAAVVVTLVDSSGATVATARTDPRGGFAFGRLDLGAYRVVVTPSSGGAAVTSRAVRITRGGEIRGLDVALAVAPPAAPQPPVGQPGPRPPVLSPRSAAFASLAVGLPAADPQSYTLAGAPRNTTRR
ncbi:MAG: SdrD B-like domain-containing protein [Planctomycetaceae bacterium]